MLCMAKNRIKMLKATCRQEVSIAVSMRALLYKEMIDYRVESFEAILQKKSTEKINKSLLIFV